MAQRQAKGIMENDVEVKIEPAGPNNDYIDDDNEIGFAGFDNSVMTITTTTTDEAVGHNLWTSHATACLINQYKKYHSMVGQTNRLRSFREMFETISLEMQAIGYRFSSQKCENKWRVLERKYKNLVFREKLKKPGRIRDYGHWEHKKALDDIFKEKRRHTYLQESDFPVPSGSIKFAEKTIREANGDFHPVQTNEMLANVVPIPEKSSDSCNKVTIEMFQSFMTEMNKNFATAEANKAKRHKEKMAMRECELEIQRELLDLKQQKMEIRKSQLTSAAQFINLMN